MLKAAILDMDGVISNSEPLHLLTFNAAFAPYKVKISKDYWARHYTGTGSVFIVKDLIKRYKLKANAASLVKARMGLFQKGVLAGKLKKTAGFDKFYSFLKAHKIRAMVASGGHKENLKAALQMLGLPRMKFIGLEDVKHRKPHPEAFLRAAKLLHAKPSECIVFEDAFAGFEAARRAKMKCIALATTLPIEEIKKQNGVHAIISDFNEKKLYSQLNMLLKN